MLLNRRPISIKCCGSEKLTEASKEFRIKRIKSIKENLNKFLLLGTGDFNEVNYHIKELDILHKEAIEGIMSRKTYPELYHETEFKKFIKDPL